MGGDTARQRRDDERTCASHTSMRVDHACDEDGNRLGNQRILRIARERRSSAVAAHLDRLGLRWTAPR